MLSISEENYLKTIFNLSESGKKQVSTNSISKFLKTKPSSVTDMIKKLTVKKLLYHLSLILSGDQIWGSKSKIEKLMKDLSITGI